MSCSNYNKLCERLIISDSVTFTNNTLVINIPQGNYCNNTKYCIVVAQNIPDTTTINAPVEITIGTGTTSYPLVYCDCTNVNACSINTRTRYSVIVKTGVGGGVFSMIKRLPCSRCINQPASLPVSTTPAPVNNTAMVVAQNSKNGGKE